MDLRGEMATEKQDYIYPKRGVLALSFWELVHAPSYKHLQALFPFYPR